MSWSLAERDAFVIIAKSYDWHMSHYNGDEVSVFEVNGKNSTHITFQDFPRATYLTIINGDNVHEKRWLSGGLREWMNILKVNHATDSI